MLLTQFNFPIDYDCWGFNKGKFNTEDEGKPYSARASTTRPADLFDIPLVRRAESACFTIAQANLANYVGMGLSGYSDDRPGVQLRLTPRLDDPNLAARSSSGEDLISPWRVLMIEEHPGKLVESNLITNLNPPSRIADTRWMARQVCVGSVERRCCIWRPETGRFPVVSI